MPHIPRAFCADCAVEMTMDKSGVIVETRVDGRGYYKIMADRYACGRCGRTIIVGMASRPLAEHFHADYAEVRAEITVDFADYSTARTA
jgi:hypothetical protein